MPDGGHSALGVGRGASDEEKKAAVDKRREERKAAQTAIDAEAVYVDTKVSADANAKLINSIMARDGHAALDIARDAGIHPKNFNDAAQYVASQRLADAGMNQEVALQGMRYWAVDANAKDATSLALQKTAADQFGSPMSGWQQQRYAQYGQGEIHPQLKGHIDELCATQYHLTQKYLADAGLKETDYITAYRGTMMRQSSVAALSGRAAIVRDNALTSVTLNRKVGEGFGRRENAPPGYKAVLLEYRIPARDVLSTPCTGFGCIKEAELVVLGGRGIIGQVVEVYE